MERLGALGNGRSTPGQLKDEDELLLFPLNFQGKEMN
jgi:hypothetical protein